MRNLPDFSLMWNRIALSESSQFPTSPRFCRQSVHSQMTCRDTANQALSLSVQRMMDRVQVLTLMINSC